MTKELEAYEKMSENQRNKYVKELVEKQLTKQFESFTSYGIFKVYKAIFWFLESYDEMTEKHIFAERYTLKYIIGAPIVYRLAIEDYKAYREGFVLKRLEEKIIKIMYSSDETIKANKELFETFERAKMPYRRLLVTSYHKISSEEKAFHFLSIYTDSSLHAKYIECELEARGKI